MKKRMTEFSLPSFLSFSYQDAHGTSQPLLFTFPEIQKRKGKQEEMKKRKIAFSLPIFLSFGYQDKHKVHHSLSSAAHERQKEEKRGARRDTEEKDCIFFYLASLHRDTHRTTSQSLHFTSPEVEKSKEKEEIKRKMWFSLLSYRVI